jgi:TRAP-type mannitol/chloroaromatic compound transport system permease large subunit
LLKSNFMWLKLSAWAFSKGAYCCWIWVAGALKSRLPRCVPPCLVTVLVAIQLGRCVGKIWWFTVSKCCFQSGALFLAICFLV